MTTWISTTTTATSSNLGWNLASGLASAYTPAPVKREPERPLAWLDREVERTCALARATP
jgi:hypothetical protein